MNDRDRIRRSNRILIGIVVLFILYGIIYRIQTGDSSLYIFGYKLDLPFFHQEVVEETTTETEETETSSEETSSEETSSEASEKETPSAQEQK